MRTTRAPHLIGMAVIPLMLLISCRRSENEVEKDPVVAEVLLWSRTATGIVAQVDVHKTDYPQYLTRSGRLRIPSQFEYELADAQCTGRIIDALRTQSSDIPVLSRTMPCYLLRITLHDGRVGYCVVDDRNGLRAFSRSGDNVFDDQTANAYEVIRIACEECSSVEVSP